ncbi:hypothetical protein AEM51_06170 [Bacteroidetes bacterium UKL13-3]|jgi:hypothetical protein|nr:hypothetical protein AEM51_06170 [Bacteroidetes bacterium UKL13-3]HCP92496.1 hypothetical protein [Bacteroidota bacterium]
MKYLLSLLIFCNTIASTTHAQSFRDYDKIKSYISVGGGINSNTGLVGVQFEQKLNDPFAVYAGAGLGTWGYKLSAGMRYYLTGAIGSAFGFGFAQATGLNGLTGKLEVIESGQTIEKEITYDLKPINLIHLSWLRYWPMGKRNRFNIEFGYSLPLSRAENNYELPANLEPSKTSKSVLQFIQPGGITISISFNFGLAERNMAKN